MMDYVALFVIALFVPALVLSGVKLYKYENTEKLFKAFAIVLLSLELFRFFYNASFYEKGTTPAWDLKFSFVSFFAVFALFAAFHTSALKKHFQNTVKWTCVLPIVIACFNPRVYTNALDTYAVVKASYFLECGVCLLLAFLLGRGDEKTVSAKKFVVVLGVSLGYVLVNFLANFFWKTYVEIDLRWGLQMVALVLSVAILFLVNVLLIPKKESDDKDGNGANG